jgi:hypothetical protein
MRPDNSNSRRCETIRSIFGSFVFNVFCVFSITASIAEPMQSVDESATSRSAEKTSVSPQTPAQSAPSAIPTRAEVQGKKKNKRRGSFVAAPLPISSPALGAGIVPVLGYIFPIGAEDHVSPPSVIGAAGLITNNGSRGFAVGANLYFKENSYQVTAGYVRGNVNYNLYGLGSGDNGGDRQLPLKQTGEAFLSEALRRVGWKFFLGPQFFAGDSLITLRASSVGNIAIPPNLGLQTSLRAIGVRLKRDTTTNRFYPTNGTFVNVTADFFSHALGSKYSFDSYKATFNKYASLTRNQVLAYNVFACGTGGSPPFYGNCIYGTNNQLRGYVAGRYFDRYMVETQLEYRLTLPKRFGVVGFGGIGGVIPGGNQPFRSKKFLPSGGAGLRFELSKAYHVNLRADLAQGKDGHTFSIGIGEAF